MTTLSDMARALEWAEYMAGNEPAGLLHLQAIEEAIAAYDPERMARCGNTAQQEARAAGDARDAAAPLLDIEVMRNVFDSLSTPMAKTAYAAVKTYIDCCNAMAGKASPFDAATTEPQP